MGDGLGGCRCSRPLLVLVIPGYRVSRGTRYGVPRCPTGASGIPGTPGYPVWAGPRRPPHQLNWCHHCRGRVCDRGPLEVPVSCTPQAGSVYQETGAGSGIRIRSAFPQGKIDRSDPVLGGRSPFIWVGIPGARSPRLPLCHTGGDVVRTQGLAAEMPAAARPGGRVSGRIVGICTYNEVHAPRKQTPNSGATPGSGSWLYVAMLC